MNSTLQAAVPRPPMLSTAQALERLLSAAREVEGSEVLPTLAAHRRVLSQPLYSTLDVPPMAVSAMDGYAVCRADLAALASDSIASSSPLSLPISQRIPAGAPAQPLAAGTVARIFTGATIPPGADAVVMQEMVTVDGEGRAVFDVQPEAGAWITVQGADIARGSEVLSAGRRLDPQALGLAASIGCATLTVRRRVKVAVLFTGDELTLPGEPLNPGGIYNSNRYTLRALLENLGCEVSDFGIVPDRFEATRDTLAAAAREHDLVLTSGGVSVGEEDHVKPAVSALGRLNLWQIALKPGKPLAFGEIDRDGPGENLRPAYFIGLPGNPVSTFVTFLLMVRPFLLRLQGLTDVAPRAYPMRADFSQAKADKRNEFLRARINGQGGLDLFPNQSSAVLTSTVWGDGLIDNPPGHAIVAGEMVRFMPFSELLN